jgi:uncharacterized protein (TIGR00369 family)
MLKIPDEDSLVSLDLVRQLMEERVPFNAYLGIKCEALSRGAVKARIPFRPELIGDSTRPAIHGGVLSSFADACCGAAVFTLLRTGDTCSTIDLRIDYLRPGRDQDILLEGKVLRIGGQLAVAEVRIYQQSGEDIAVAKAVFMVRRRQDDQLQTLLNEP